MLEHDNCITTRMGTTAQRAGPFAHVTVADLLKIDTPPFTTAKSEKSGKRYLVLPDFSKVLTRKSVIFRPVKFSKVSVVFCILCEKNKKKQTVELKHFLKTIGLLFGSK